MKQVHTSKSAVSHKTIRNYDKPWNSSSPKLTYESLKIKWKTSVPKNWKKVIDNPRPKTAIEKSYRPTITENTFKHKTEVISNQDQVLQFNIQDGSSNEQVSNTSELNKSIYHRDADPSYSSIPIKIITTPSYAMQYLGITKGQIGIFTKRLPLPQLSSYETCHNTPMSMIYSTYSPPSSSRKMSRPKVYTALNLTKNTPSHRRSVSNISIKESTEEQLEEQILPPELPESIQPEKEQKDENWSELDNYWPDPTQYDQQVIHTYARPRAISQFRHPDSLNPSTPINLEHFNPQHSVFKDRFKSYKNRSVETPALRIGMMGYKLSRPKSVTIKKTKTRTAKTPAVKVRDEKLEVLEKTQEPLKDSKFRREPYLIYLAAKNSKYDINK